MKIFNTHTPLYLTLSLLVLLAACKGKSAGGDEGDDAKVEAITPVTVTTINDSTLVDYTSLNATSTFQQKNIVKANANGYVQGNLKPGQYVNQGQVMFTIKTKEAQTIGNTINVLDTTFKFSGLSKIKAPAHGYLTQLNHQSGDYVADGEQLAIISDRASFAFVMQLPYEMRSTVKLNQDVQLTLPDSRKITGKVSSFMPSVDTTAQTQGVVIKISAGNDIPENLIAKAQIIRSSKSHTQSLPKTAVLTNETQTDFWVMKLINNNTAVKVPVTKGIDVGDRVEILTPKFGPTDKIVVTGNYGLADTAKVNIVK
ncbi:efflux RND transporter periplasmic adaptor subunit [Mucilaginibacter sp. dw_454]|uniref:efflux RND transporter periplasmic adaptor subunit n=1 Tax=Mucilaginibacter sp. dw_454 TaxID=2720079 RepID=UPI001BD5705F|nr:efflux RND transporter periplasmic adaptor subunit [Mucilaginibacter sp. dw_454]